MALPRRPKAVAFDLDGTLIDSEHLVREAYRIATRQFGVDISDQQFLALVGLNRAANDATLLSYWGADFPLERFHEATRAVIGERVAPLKPGARELLEILVERRAPIGLATASGKPWVERHFAAHGLHVHFKAVITREDVAQNKPHPEPYLRVSAALGAEPCDVLALEDSHAGVTAAHAAGCMTIMVPDLLPPSDCLRDKARVVSSLHDVVTLVR